MDSEMIIYAVGAIILLFVIIKLLKWPIKLFINGVAGLILLYLANFIGNYLDFSLAINLFNIIIAGILGIPGIIILVIFQFLQ